jgi:hypothetical protein
LSKSSTDSSYDSNIEDEEEKECDEDETTEIDLRPKKRVRYGDGGGCGRK